MSDLLAEIAKHLAFYSKMIVKLCVKRYSPYIKIFSVPVKVQEKWNQERIILFPDIRELHFRYIWKNPDVVLQFDPQIIAGMKLISFKFYDVDGYHGKDSWNIDFQFLKNMRTLKQLYFFTGDSYAWIKIDDILKTLDLEYLDNNADYGASDLTVRFDSDSIKHMKLKAFNYIATEATDNYTDDNGNDATVMPSLRYLNLDNTDDMVAASKCDHLHTLRLTIGNNTMNGFLSGFKSVNRLYLHVQSRNLDDRIDFSFLREMNLYELHVYQETIYANFLPPPEYCEGIRRIFIYAASFYSDNGLKKFEPGVMVKHMPNRFNSIKI